MSEARVLPFRQPPNAPSAEARHGRFMIVPDIDALADVSVGIPADVKAFAFDRMILEFQLGRPLADDEAAYRLHKHAATVARFRREYPEFLALMDGASGHARHKFRTRKAGKSFLKAGKESDKSSQKVADPRPRNR